MISRTEFGPGPLRHLVCPETHEDLIRQDGALINTSGSRRYPLLGAQKVTFLSQQQDAQASAKSEGDFINKAKDFVRNTLGRHYGTFVFLISPVMPRMHWSTFETLWRYTARTLSEGKELIVQVGSGNARLFPGVVNIDIFAYGEVDIVADCAALPYRNDSIDGVVSVSVVEHVERPDVMLQEAFRVLKPGGFIVTGAPFLEGFHACPADFMRWSRRGLQIVHERCGFEGIRVIPAGGPTSAMLWVFQEWLAMVLSLGIRPLYLFWLAFLYVALAPMKLLDAVLVYHPEAFRVGSSFLCVANKPAHKSH